MTLNPLGMMVLVAAGLAGCGDYSCEDFCEDRADCPDSQTNPDSCEANCEELDRQNEDFGCDDEYDAVLKCVSALDDVCALVEAQKECGNEADAWGDCIIDYCSEHPTAGNCEAPLPEAG